MKKYQLILGASLVGAAAAAILVHRLRHHHHHHGHASHEHTTHEHKFLPAMNLPFIEGSFLTPYYERMSKFMPGGSTFYGLLGQRILDSAIEFHEKDKKTVVIIDVGAGTGRVSFEVLERHMKLPITERMPLRLISVDPDQVMLSQAQKKLENFKKQHEALLQDVQLDFMIGFAEDLKESFPAGSADIITSALAIHHIDENEKQKAINAFFTTLRPDGGKLIIGDFYTDPAKRTFMSRFGSHGSANLPLPNLIEDAGFVEGKNEYVNNLFFILPAHLISATKKSQ